MADIIKTSNVLSLEQEFTDGDTRTITLDNPKASITAADINAVGTYNQANQVLVGDKTGAAFLRFKKAVKIVKSTTYLDLTPTT